MPKRLFVEKVNEKKKARMEGDIFLDDIVITLEPLKKTNVHEGERKKNGVSVCCLLCRCLNSTLRTFCCMTTSFFIFTLWIFIFSSICCCVGTTVFVIFVRLFFSNECTDFYDLRTRESAMKCYKTASFSHYEREYRRIATDFSSYPKYNLDLAIFRQTLKAGPPTFPGAKIDITSRMKELVSKNFTDWFTAEVEMSDIFRLTRDAHFNLEINPEIKNIAFLHPVGITSSVSENGDQKFYFKTNGIDELSAVQIRYNLAYFTLINFYSLNGLEIVRIDGKDPKTAIKEVCQNFAFSRDDSSCLNDLIRVYWWKKKDLIIFGVPQKPIIYDFINSDGETETIELDFLSCQLYGKLCYYFLDNTHFLAQLRLVFEDADEEEKGNQRRSETGVLQLAETTSPRDEEIMKRGLRKATNLRSTIERTESISMENRRAKNNVPKILQIGACAHKCNDEFGHEYIFYQFEGIDDTAVLYFSGMRNCPEMVYSFNECIKNEFSSGRYKKLVLDLRDNGGGIIFWGLYVVSGLIRRTMIHSDQFLGPLVMTKKMMNEYAIPNWDSIINLGAGNRDVFMRERDGSVSEYAPFCWWKSGITHMSLGNGGRKPLQESTGFIGFDEENFVVLLDGSCGSTCGMMVKVLTAGKAARTVLLGGFAGEDFDISSFEGSGVMKEELVYGGSGGGVRKYSWSWGAYVNPTFDGFFDKSKLNVSNLLGYSVTNADHNLYVYDQFDPEENDKIVYDTIVGVLPQCASWNVKEDPNCKVFGVGVVKNIPKGVYGRPCGSNGYFDMAAPCVLKRCEDGYYMDEAKTECRKLSSAPMYDIFNQQQKK